MFVPLRSIGSTPTNGSIQAKLARWPEEAKQSYTLLLSPFQVSDYKNVSLHKQIFLYCVRECVEPVRHVIISAQHKRGGLGHVKFFSWN